MLCNRILKGGALFCLAILSLWLFPVGRAQALEISAESAAVLLAGTGASLYEKDAHTPRPMASTTKIMTALLTLEAAEDLGNPLVEITPEMAAVEGSSMGLEAGDLVSLQGLAQGMLLASGNDAANAAALYLDGSLEGFARRMNRRAAQIGMEDTWFVTPSGLDGADEEGREHVSTAWDMALLAREAINHPGFLSLCSQKEAIVPVEGSGRQLFLHNHNRLLGEYEGCVGVKTGFTKKAGRCLVSAAQRGTALVIAVTLHAPDDWSDHAQLLDYGFSQVRAVALEGGQIQVELPVVGSGVERIAAQGGEGGDLSLGPQDVLETRVFAPRFLYAPLRPGDKMGEVRWYCRGECVARADLKALGEAPAE